MPRRIGQRDADIDAWLEAKRESPAKSGGINLAQVLVSVPEGASEIGRAPCPPKRPGPPRRW